MKRPLRVVVVVVVVDVGVDASRSPEGSVNDGGRPAVATTTGDARDEPALGWGGGAGGEAVGGRLAGAWWWPCGG